MGAPAGNASASTPGEAAEGAEFVVTCVGNDDDVRAVTLAGDGVLAGMAVGSMLVDHTTTSAVLARELAVACAERGFGFVDAPEPGGQAGAEDGRLTVMCGSDDPATFEAARPVIVAYAAKVERLGPAGAGQLTKMVSQICIAGVVQGLAEAVDFAQRAGLDTAQVFDVIGKGAAQSWQMDNRTATMAAGEFEFGFAVEWMRKDLGFCLDEAARMERGCRWRRSSTSSTPRSSNRRPALGHQQPRAPAAAALTLAREPPTRCSEAPGTTPASPADRPPSNAASPLPVRSRNWDGTVARVPVRASRNVCPFESPAHHVWG